MTAPAPTILSERFGILGRVGARSFGPWILRHAGRLGLGVRLGPQNDQRLTLEVCGPPDLIDALELGCSLGPIEVWVDRIERESIPPLFVAPVISPLAPNQASA